MKKHKWFKSIDWGVAVGRQMKPPYIPDKPKGTVNANFDPYPDSYTRADTLKITDEQQEQFRDFGSM